MSTTTVIERTNQRDFTHFVLIAKDDGTPHCPHCGKPMALTQHGTFENSMCPCWWIGANSGVYHAQVVVALSDEADAAWLARQSDFELQRKTREQEIVRLVPKHLADMRSELAAKGAHKAVAAIDRGQPRWNHLFEARCRAQNEIAKAGGAQ
jgi:hypothetical protein